MTTVGMEGRGEEKNEALSRKNKAINEILSLIKKNEMEKALNKTLSQLNQMERLNEKMERIHLMQSVFLEHDAHKEAEKLARMGLKYKRSDAQSLIILGEIELDRNNRDMAMKYFKRAMKLDPDNYNASVGVAFLLELDKEFQKAETHYRKIIERFPERVEAYERLAHIYAMRHNFDGLRILREKAEKNDIETPFIHIAFAQSALMTGNFQEALMHILYGLQEWPYDESLNAMLPVMLGLTGNTIIAKIFALLFRSFHSGTDMINRIFKDIISKSHPEWVEKLREFLLEDPPSGDKKEKHGELPPQFEDALNAGRLDFLLSVAHEIPEEPEKLNELLESNEKKFTAGIKLTSLLYREWLNNITNDMLEDLKNRGTATHYYFLRREIDIDPEDDKIKSALSELDEEERKELMMNGMVRLYRAFPMSIGADPSLLVFHFPEFSQNK